MAYLESPFRPVSVTATANPWRRAAARPKYPIPSSSCIAAPPRPQLPLNRSFQFETGSQASNMMFESVLGVSVAATRQNAVSYTHLRAHETPEHLVCRLLL